jgi:hypothetical protein
MNLVDGGEKEGLFENGSLTVGHYLLWGTGVHAVHIVLVSGETFLGFDAEGLLKGRIG